MIALISLIFPFTNDFPKENPICAICVLSGAEVSINL